MVSEDSPEELNLPSPVFWLSSANGVYVRCREDGGAEGWLPLSELFRLFEEMVRQAKAQEGLRQ